MHCVACGWFFTCILLLAFPILFFLPVPIHLFFWILRATSKFVCWYFGKKNQKLNFVLRNVEAAKGNVLTEATTKSPHQKRFCHVYICMSTSSQSNKLKWCIAGYYYSRNQACMWTKMVILLAVAARDVYSYRSSSSDVRFLQLVL
jgi:hypothetical protein